MPRSSARRSQCFSERSARARARARAANPALPRLLAGLRLRAAPRVREKALFKGGVVSATRSDT
eukprot:6107922-Alexandrium_andersonii.AAC.1